MLKSAKSRLGAAAVVASALGVGACNPVAPTLEACFGSAGFSQVIVEFAQSLTVRGAFMAKPTFNLEPEYVVKFVFVNGPEREASIFLATEFGSSTPLTVSVTPKQEGRKAKVPRATTQNAADFVKERLEELSDATFSVQSATVSGSGAFDAPDSYDLNLKVKYRATVLDGELAGRSFTGTMKIGGTASDFVSDL